jgi:hypothetical protein
MAKSVVVVVAIVVVVVVVNVSVANVLKVVTMVPHQQQPLQRVLLQALQ